MKKLFVAAAVCAACVDWTRFTGTVKVINLQTSTVTIQTKSGDYVRVPVDYQIKMFGKKEEVLELKNLHLDEEITLLRVPADAPPPQDTTGMALPEASQKGK